MEIYFGLKGVKYKEARYSYLLHNLADILYNHIVDNLRIEHKFSTDHMIIEFIPYAENRVYVFELDY